MTDGLLVFGLLAWSGVFAGRAAQDEDALITVKLTSMSVQKAGYRLAPGLQARDGKLPKKAWRAEIHERAYLFFDLDGNGKLEAGTGDGFARENTPFVVFLPRALLFPEGQYVPAYDRKQQLTLTRQELELDPLLILQVARVNEMRMRGARRPVVIDREACGHAELHLDYLELNGLAQRLSLDVHREDPAARGYTLEGAKAGMNSVIGFGRAFWEDLAGWYGSTFHGAKILDPDLERIGVSRKHGLSMLVTLEDAWDGPEPVVHPPDGAVDIPVAFSLGGEIPNPAPETDMGKGCGFPLIVMLPTSHYGKRLVGFELLDPEDRSVPGYASTPAQPANSQLPTNLGCAFFIPDRRLLGGKTYRAHFELEGLDAPLEWSFTTAER